jgi:hypothetical protein
MEFSAPQNWATWLVGVLTAALLWVVRGYAADVKAIKGTYMKRSEVEAALKDNAAATAAVIATHQAATNASFAELRAQALSRQEETSANFREIRLRLDQLNDTLLKVALK